MEAAGLRHSSMKLLAILTKVCSLYGDLVFPYDCDDTIGFQQVAQVVQEFSGEEINRFCPSSKDVMYNVVI